jgi:predicted NACHT family NTPase
LNPNNHAVSRFETAEAYTEAYRAYLVLLVKELGEVEDAITGNRLKVEDQLIYITADAREEAAGRGITGVQRNGWSDATDMQSLATLLAAPSSNRHQGTHEAQRVLMLAGPGTGKTWSTQQLAYLIAQTAQEAKGALPLLPLLVPVQRMLAVLKRAKVDVAGRPHTLLVEFIKQRYAEAPATRDALLQAYDLRQLVVILDGADEAAALRVSAPTHFVAKRSAL